MADGSEDHEAGEHPESSYDESFPTTEVLNNVKTAERAEEVDGTEDDCGNVAVAQSSGCENGCAVVEEKVGTGELLQGLESDTEGNTVCHTRTSNDLVEGVFAASILGIELGLDLANLTVDLVVALGNTVD